MPLNLGHAAVYDTGALLATEADNHRMLSFHRDVLKSRKSIIVLTPVLTQAWRDGRKQARLARLLKACTVEPPDVTVAKYAGVLLGRSRTSDAVDAMVVATALAWHASIVTSDPGDLSALLDVAEVRFRPDLMVV